MASGQHEHGQESTAAVGSRGRSCRSAHLSCSALSHLKRSHGGHCQHRSQALDRPQNQRPRKIVEVYCPLQSRRRYPQIAMLWASVHARLNAGSTFSIRYIDGKSPQLDSCNCALLCLQTVQCWMRHDEPNFDAQDRQQHTSGQTGIGAGPGCEERSRVPRPCGKGRGTHGSSSRTLRAAYGHWSSQEELQ